MSFCLLSVDRQGRHWGVSADGEVLALSRRKREAQRLAKRAARTLRDSGFETQVVVADEARTFKAHDDVG